MSKTHKITILGLVCLGLGLFAFFFLSFFLASWGSTWLYGAPKMLERAPPEKSPEVMFWA